MTTASLAATWKLARAQRQARRRARPTLLRFLEWAARTLPTWRGVRTSVMQYAGFASIDYGLFAWRHIAGYLAIGVSLLVLEALGGER